MSLSTVLRLNQTPGIKRLETGVPLQAKEPCQLEGYENKARGVIGVEKMSEFTGCGTLRQEGKEVHTQVTETWVSWYKCVKE